MFEGTGYAILYGFLLAFAIGPIFFILIETSITKGFRSALSFDLGAILADIVFILIAFFSTSQILQKVSDDPNLLIFGGVILVVYGVISFIKTSKSFRKIYREHHDKEIKVKKNLLGLFIKGFLLNFINFGVLAGWIGTIIMANALTTSTQGVVVFLATVLASLLVTDIIKISLAKKLQNKMTPRFIFKTKKWVSILIIAFGLFLVYQGFFLQQPETDSIQDRLENIKEKLPE
ncbi:MAG: LysE family transporter [Flavobacteriaceae bacterium]|nr:LysE family transporter [Flavobacteriaceae bacterium]